MTTPAYRPIPPGGTAAPPHSPREAALVEKMAAESVPKPEKLSPADQLVAEWEKTIAIKCARYELEHFEEIKELRAKAQAAVVPFGRPLPKPGSWGAEMVESQVRKAICALHPAWPTKDAYVRSKL